MIYNVKDYVHGVSWEPEGHYWCSKMFRWEAEWRYRCTKSRPMVIYAPFWFSMEYRWTASMPFWFSMEHHWTVLMPFWLSANDVIHHSITVIMQKHSQLSGLEEKDYQMKSLFPKPDKSTFGTSEKKRFLWQNLYTCQWENKI